MNREPDLEVVAQVGTVAEGRRRLTEGGIDIAIVDVPLPDEYGIELVRELHGANPSIPVLVLTDVQDLEDHQRLLQAGANEVLSKEITYDQVLAAVRRLGEARVETDALRILFAYEETHLSYRDVLVIAIRALRPHVAVTVASFRNLESEIKRLDPHLVVCSRPNTFDPGGRPAWYKLSPETGIPSEFCLDGQYRNLADPGLQDLLEIIDETERQVQSGRDLRGC